MKKDKYIFTDYNLEIVRVSYYGNPMYKVSMGDGCDFVWQYVTKEALLSLANSIYEEFPDTKQLTYFKEGI